MSNYQTIGTVTIDKIGDEVTENHTSYAADHRTYRVLPGTYEMRLVGRPGSQEVIVTVDVDVLNDTTYSGFGGVNYASTVRENFPSTKTYQVYDYQAAKALSDGTAFLGGFAQLGPDWTVVTKHVQLSPLSERDERTDRERVYVSRRFAPAATA
jgi:hypothetical protein